MTGLTAALAAFVHQPGFDHPLPPEAVRIIKTGFADTLATLVAAGLSLREAMPLANKAGGVVVGKFGTATVSYEELMA